MVKERLALCVAPNGRLAPRRPALVAPAAALVALLVGASRVYLGVHWLTDVLGGFALGLAWLAIVMVATRYVRRSP